MLKWIIFDENIVCMKGYERIDDKSNIQLLILYCIITETLVC